RKGIARSTCRPALSPLLRPGPCERSGPPTPTARRPLTQATRACPGRFASNLRSGLPLAAVREFLTIYSRPSLTWDELSWLRGLTTLPILLKGLLHPDDARLAVDHGVDGIVVSNHGGRQVDGAIASLDALPAVAQAVARRIPIVFDSGVRGGADAFKALALGATAVLIGRPYVYGLGIAGEAGVREVIENLLADFDLTMGLAGCRSIAEIDRTALTPAAAA